MLLVVPLLPLTGCGRRRDCNSWFEEVHNTGLFNTGLFTVAEGEGMVFRLRFKVDGDFSDFIDFGELGDFGDSGDFVGLSPNEGNGLILDNVVFNESIDSFGWCWSEGTSFGDGL